MDTKKIILFIFLLAASNSFAMKLKNASGNIELTKFDAFHIFSKNEKSTAKTIAKSKKIIMKAKNKDLPNTSLDVRLCIANKGLAMVYQNENKEYISVCEFEDKSMILAEDLAVIYNSIAK